MPGSVAKLSYINANVAINLVWPVELSWHAGFSGEVKLHQCKRRYQLGLAG